MDRVRVFLLLFLAAAALAEAGPAPVVGAKGKVRAVPYDVHSGYFVRNDFEEGRPASFVIARDQAAFDKVFGAAYVMGDASHRLPKDAFRTLMVVSAIQRGKATWQYQVKSAEVRDGRLTLSYRVTETPSPSTSFACPLIVSVPKANYTLVRFVENGKLVKELPVK